MLRTIRWTVRHCDAVCVAMWLASVYFYALYWTEFGVWALLLSLALQVALIALCGAGFARTVRYDRAVIARIRAGR